MATSRVAVVLGFAAVAISVAALAVALSRDTGPTSRVEGSGVSQTVSRTVPAFSKVELAGTGFVRVQPGSPQGVTVSGDDNIVPLITTEVLDGTLVVDETGGSFSTHTPLVVDVRVPAITGSSLSGTGELTVEGVSGTTFTADLSGTGKLDVGGHVTTLDANVSGTGSAELEHLVARDARVDLSGTGSAHVFVTGSLDASVDGTGSVIYGGNPQHVQKQVTGLGAVSTESE